MLANATKAAKIIESEGAAISRLVLANATYESIAAIAGNSSAAYIEQLTSQYLYFEALKDIAETGDAMIVVVGGNQTVPFIVSP